MDDVFQHAMIQVHKEAPRELAQGFRQKLDFIKERSKHNERTVQSCLAGMSDPPTLLEILTAAFVVNGGVLFKHGFPADEDEVTELDMDRLEKELDSLAWDDP
jgi:hypothetical protein